MSHSVSDAIHAHDRKGMGREGKGREGNRRSPSIHNVTQVTRETAPEQTVTPADEWMEHFDFEAEVPCAHSWHQTHHDTSQPASYILHVRHSCGWGSTYPICKSGWAMFTSGGGYRCLGCAGLGDLSSVTIVEVLR